jgi:hypothetical protein
MLCFSEGLNFNPSCTFTTLVQSHVNLTLVCWRLMAEELAAFGAAHAEQAAARRRQALEMRAAQHAQDLAAQLCNAQPAPRPTLKVLAAEAAPVPGPPEGSPLLADPMEHAKLETPAPRTPAGAPADDVSCAPAADGIILVAADEVGSAGMQWPLAQGPAANAAAAAGGGPSTCPAPGGRSRSLSFTRCRSSKELVRHRRRYWWPMFSRSLPRLHRN